MAYEITINQHEIDKALNIEMHDGTLLIGIYSKEQYLWIPVEATEVIEAINFLLRQSKKDL